MREQPYRTCQDQTTKFYSRTCQDQTEISISKHVKIKQKFLFQNMSRSNKKWLFQNMSRSNSKILFQNITRSNKKFYSRPCQDQTEIFFFFLFCSVCFVARVGQVYFILSLFNSVPTNNYSFTIESENWWKSVITAIYYIYNGQNFSQTLTKPILHCSYICCPFITLHFLHYFFALLAYVSLM